MSKKIEVWVVWDKQTDMIASIAKHNRCGVVYSLAIFENEAKANHYMRVLSKNPDRYEPRQETLTVGVGNER